MFNKHTMPSFGCLSEYSQLRLLCRSERRKGHGLPRTCSGTRSRHAAHPRASSSRESANDSCSIARTRPTLHGATHVYFHVLHHGALLFQVVPNRLTVLDDRLHRLKNDRLRHTLHSISTFTFNAVLSPWTLPRRIISPALLSISDCRSSRRLVSRLCARSLALRMPDDPWFFG